jgi:hypothetical protein
MMHDNAYEVDALLLTSRYLVTQQGHPYSCNHKHFALLAAAIEVRVEHM